MKKNTSWQQSSAWYNELVGSKGHYYHEHVIMPGVLKLAQLKKGNSVLDLGCGQGVLARSLPQGVSYWGVDLATGLLNFAKKQNRNKEHHYVCADATKNLPIKKYDFTHACAVLALQNMKEPERAVANASKHVARGGLFVLVLNHPCFRIPRQSGWGVHEHNKEQYRWITRYMTPLKVPLEMHPGKARTEITWSFHEPLSHYVHLLSQNHFVIKNMEEWISDKTSMGRTGTMENRARMEIPLFMAIIARKQ